MGTKPQRTAGAAGETASGDGAECAQETGGGGEDEGRSGTGRDVKPCMAGKGGLADI